jgi:hypothetical protein
MSKINSATVNHDAIKGHRGAESCALEGNYAAGEPGVIEGHFAAVEQGVDEGHVAFGEHRPAEAD